MSDDITVIDGKTGMAAYRGEWMYGINAATLDEAIAELHKLHPEYQVKKVIAYGHVFYFPKETTHGS